MSEKNEKTIKKTETIFLQYGGKEICIDTVRVAVCENYDAVKNGEDPAIDIKIYLKPEDAKAYYVINDDYAGEVELSFE